jgi:hypothetical protein
MNSWHLIPWTFQYLVSGSSILIVASVLFSKNKRSLAYQVFFIYSFCTAGWLLLAFLHRNAPSAELSDLFFRVDIFFVLVSWGILPVFILSLWGARKSFFWLAVPASIIGVYFLFIGPHEIFWTELGWSYKFSKGFSRLFFIMSALELLLFFAVSLRLGRRISSKTLAKKYTIALISYLVFYAAGMVITTWLIQKYPEFPPLGGILTLIQYMFLAYTASLRPERITPYSELEIPMNELAKAYITFLNNFQTALPGDELGESSFQFRDYIEAMGLEKVVVFKSGNLVFNIDEFSKEKIYETPDNILRLLKSFPRRVGAAGDMSAVLLKTMETVDLLFEGESYDWIQKTLRDHGGFLAKNDLLGAGSLNGYLPSFLRELKPGRAYLFQEDSPQKAYAVLRDAGSFNIRYLCLTKLSIDLVKEKYFLPEDSVIQVGFAAKPAMLEPGDLQGLTKAVLDFLAVPDGAIILLDCLDQVKFAVGFEKTFEFLKKIKVMSAVNNAIFLVSVPPMMFDLNEIQALEQELRTGTQP